MSPFTDFPWRRGMDLRFFLLLLQLYVVHGHSPNSKHCIILKNHPGTCLHFLTEQTYTYNEGKKACWEKYHAVPFVPISDSDVADLLQRFYFHVVDDSVYKGHLTLGILCWDKYFVREHLGKHFSETETRPNLVLWNDTIYQGKLKIDSAGKIRDEDLRLDYPQWTGNDYWFTHMFIDLKTAKLESTKEWGGEGYFACHSPRYPKFNCPQDKAYTDYESRSCMFGKFIEKERTNRNRATEYCKQNEANLASIHNQREYDIYYSLVGVYGLKDWEKKTEKGYNEYWFGLRHQNNIKSIYNGGLGSSNSRGFDERYKKIAYFVDGSKYTGFHRFHEVEPTQNAWNADYNGQTFTANGWYRNWPGHKEFSGALCRSVVDISGLQH